MTHPRAHSGSGRLARRSRFMFALIAALSVAFLLAGCGGSAPSTTTAGESVSPLDSLVVAGSSTSATSSSLPAVSTTVDSQSAPVAVPPDVGAPVEIVVLYDNRAAVTGVAAGWGFSCVIRGFERTVLFDTGATGEALLHNMEALGVDPAEIDAVVLSHDHDDHKGGLEALLAANASAAVYRATSSAQTICAGVRVTAGMGEVNECALLLATGNGAVLITGCAHPGIVEMVDAASVLAGEPVAAVLGGFHLSSASVAETDRIAEALAARGVLRCGPAHCTGEVATSSIRAVFGSGFIEMGVGTVVMFQGEEE